MCFHHWGCVSGTEQFDSCDMEEILMSARVWGSGVGLNNSHGSFLLFFQAAPVVRIFQITKERPRLAPSDVSREFLAAQGACGWNGLLKATSSRSQLSATGVIGALLSGASDHPLIWLIIFSHRKGMGTCHTLLKGTSAFIPCGGAVTILIQNMPGFQPSNSILLQKPPCLPGKVLHHTVCDEGKWKQTKCPSVPGHPMKPWKGMRCSPGAYLERASENTKWKTPSCRTMSIGVNPLKEKKKKT